MTKSELSKIANKANNDILAIKKQYAENMCKWLESYVEKNLAWRALHHAKRGYTSFILCNIKMSKSKYIFMDSWRFSHEEMQGGLSKKFWYDQDSEGYRWGPFLDVKSILDEKLLELSEKYKHELSFKPTGHKYREGYTTWSYDVIVIS